MGMFNKFIVQQNLYDICSPLALISTNSEKRFQLFKILFAATCIALISGCKLERIDPPCPTIIMIEPAGAHSGDIVAIKGTNFLPGVPQLYRVKIGDSTLSGNDIIDVPDSNTLRFKVPVGIGNGRISVSLAGETICSTTQAIDFTYYYRGTMVSKLTGEVYSPRGIDLDNVGNLVVADLGHNQIKVIDTSTGEIIKIHGKGGQGGCDSNYISTEKASFSLPIDIDVDLRGNIYIPEPGNEVILWMDANRPGTVQIFAGGCGRDGTDIYPVQRLDAKLSDPFSVASDEVTSTFYFTDAGSIRKIETYDIVKPQTAKPIKGYFYGIEISRSRKGAGPIFVTDFGALPEVKPSIKSVDEGGSAKIIDLKSPNILARPVALSLDSQGNIFVADNGANQIFVIYTNGVMEILAGTGGVGGYVEDVPGLRAKFNEPTGIALNEKDGVLMSVYVSDSKNNVVRTIDIE